MKKNYIFIVILIIFSLYSCNYKKNNSENKQANNQYAQRTYESLSLYKSIYDDNGFDEIRKMIFSEKDNNYYISIYNSHKNEERIDIYNSKFEYIKTLKNDISKLDQDYIRFFAFGIDNDSNIYMVKINSDENGQIINTDRSMLIFNKNGKLKREIIIEDTINIWDSSILSNIFITENNFILVSSVGIQITDKNGKTIKEITSDNEIPYYITSADIGEDDTLYYTTNMYLKKYNLLDYNEIWSVEDSKGRTMSCVSYSSEDNQICVKIQQSLNLYNTKGSYLGEICDLRDFNSSLEKSDINDYDSGFISSILYENNMNILFSYIKIANENVSTHSHLSYSEIVKLQSLNENDSKKVNLNNQDIIILKIFLPYYDISFDRIVYDYQKSNSNIDIEMQYFCENPLYFNFEDYIEYISKKISSNDIDWDIISGDYIQKKIYTENGYFVNINNLDKNNILKDDRKYFNNIINACRENNGDLFIFPNKIFFTALESLKDGNYNISTLKSFLDKASELIEHNNLSLLYDKTSYNYISGLLYTELCNLDYEKLCLNEKEFFYKLEIIKEFFNDSLYTEKIDNAAFNIHRFIYLSDTSYKVKESIMLLPSLSLNKNIFDVNGLLISSNSNNSDIAFDFLIYISEYENDFLGISRKKLDTQLNKLEIATKSTIANNTSLQSDNLQIKIEQFKKDIIIMYETLNYCSTYDNNFIKFYNELLSKYLNNVIDKYEFLEKIKSYYEVSEN